MNKIKFNNTEYEVESYNKNTYFSADGTITSNASCSIVTDDISTLNSLAQEEITRIQITHNNDMIYNSQNISARIESFSEYLNADKIDVGINLVFTEDSDI